MSVKPYNHPEFIEYPNFDDFVWSNPHGKMSTTTPGQHTVDYISNKGALREIRDEKGIVTRTFVHKDLERIENFQNGFISSAVTIVKGKIVKKEFLNRFTREEIWMTTIDGNQKTTAIRRSKGDVLSDFDSARPAVVICAFSPFSLERREFWTHGVPKRVRLIDVEALRVLADENLKDGNRDEKLQNIMVLGVWSTSAVALWNRNLAAFLVPSPESVSKKSETPETPEPVPSEFVPKTPEPAPKETPPLKNVALITADQARKMKKETIEEITIRFNVAVEGAIFERKTSVSQFKLDLRDNICKEFQALLKEAGYEIQCDADSLTVFW